MKYNAIVIDDSETIRKFISFGLKMKGINVMIASDGQEGLEKILVHKPDIIITDLNMPNMDGFELIENVRNDAEHAETPIIVLTTESQEEERQRAIGLGADSFLVKPFRVNIIIAEIQRLLGEPS